MTDGLCAIVMMHLPLLASVFISLIISASVPGSNAEVNSSPIMIGAF